MKDFQEFIEVLDPDEYNTIQMAANQAMRNADRFEEADRAYYIAIELLHRYHIWVNKA